MKKILGLVLVSFLVTTTYAVAAPNVVSDSFTASLVDECEITIDGTVTPVAPVPTMAGQARCEFDVGGVSEGQHTISMLTRNVWGVSEPVPFDFAKELPPSLLNIRLEN